MGKQKTLERWLQELERKDIDKMKGKFAGPTNVKNKVRAT